MKRVFDLLVSLVVILILLPILLVISILIVLDSPGGVFFIQERLGKHNIKFHIFKFRTMKRNVDPYALSPASENDQRVTRIGKILRHTSLDELPNLINVIKGDMSLVGPRAIDEKQFNLRKSNVMLNNPDRKDTYIKMFDARSTVKPGITGLAQVMGRSGLTPEKSIEYDYEYVLSRNFLFDFKILISTFRSVVERKGIN